MGGDMLFEIRRVTDELRAERDALAARVETLEADNRFIRCELDVESIKHDQSVARLTARVETLTAERDAAQRMADHTVTLYGDNAWAVANAERDRREQAEARVETLESGLRWYDDHKSDDGSYDGAVWGDLSAIVASRPAGEETQG